MNKSSIARVHQIAWNTVDRWLEKAAASCRRCDHQRITKIQICELQADEIRTLVGGKEQSPVWVFAAIEVWSRLWPATVVGKRSDSHTLSHFRDVLARAKTAHIPLIATDGFKFFRQVVLSFAPLGPSSKPGRLYSWILFLSGTNSMSCTKASGVGYSLAGQTEFSGFGSPSIGAIGGRSP